MAESRTPEAPPSGILLASYVAPVDLTRCIICQKGMEWDGI